MTITLYHFNVSGPSRAALLAARNLNLDIEIKVINLLEKEQCSRDFIAINPQHTVPTLDDHGFILWESRAIMSYLVDSKSPNNSLYPTDPKKRALINQRLYFDATVFFLALRNICRPVLFGGETKISDDKRAALVSALSFLETFLESSKWLCGDNVTIADLSILTSVAMMFHLGVDFATYPKIKDWYKQCRTLPGFEENEVGAKIYAAKINSTLVDKF